jgi:hypothetical protein
MSAIVTDPVAELDAGIASAAFAPGHLFTTGRSNEDI